MFSKYILNYYFICFFISSLLLIVSYFFVIQYQYLFYFFNNLNKNFFLERKNEKKNYNELNLKNSIIYMVPFLQKMFFSGFSRIKIKYNNNNFILKRFYGDFYKFDNNFIEEMEKEIKQIKGLTKKERNSLMIYIKNNGVHYKFGQEIIEKDGSVTFYAYDLTTKGKSKVYFHLNKEIKDQY